MVVDWRVAAHKNLLVIPARNLAPFAPPYVLVVLLSAVVVFVAGAFVLQALMVTMYGFAFTGAVVEFYVGLHAEGMPWFAYAGATLLVFMFAVTMISPGIIGIGLVMAMMCAARHSARMSQARKRRLIRVS